MTVQTCRPFAAVVFDMDGVLLDTEAVYDECWRIEAKRLGLCGIDAVHRECLGLGMEDAVLLLNRHYGDSFDGNAFWHATDALGVRIMQERGVPLKPLALEILQYLSAKGYRLALASSSGHSTVERMLGGAGLLHFFSVLACGDAVKKSKPAPDLYMLACKELSCEPQTCVAVEDSPNGLASALAAGLFCVLVPDRIPVCNESAARAWKVCRSLSDLRTFL